jgi:hypothetical protein
MSGAGDREIVEVIRFRPRPGAERSLLEGRAAAVAVLRREFSMRDSTLCRESAGDLWVDVMKFRSEDDADRAVAEELGHAEFADWVANVEEVVSRERLWVAAT